MIWLSDDGNFADNSTFSFTGSRLDHVDSRSYPITFQVASIPCKSATVAFSLSYQNTIAGNDLYIGIKGETNDSY